MLFAFLLARIRSETSIAACQHGGRGGSTIPPMISHRGCTDHGDGTRCTPHSRRPNQLFRRMVRRSREHTSPRSVALKQRHDGGCIMPIRQRIYSMATRRSSFRCPPRFAWVGSVDTTTTSPTTLQREDVISRKGSSTVASVPSSGLGGGF